MLRMVALAGGLWCVWLALAASAGPARPILGGLIALAIAALGMRLGVIGAATSILRIPGFAFTALAQTLRVVQGGLRVARGALGAPEQLRPGFIRMRAVPGPGLIGAGQIAASSATADLAVVDVTGEAVLVHAFNEDAADVSGLAAIWRPSRSGGGEGSAA